MSAKMHLRVLRGGPGADTLGQRCQSPTKPVQLRSGEGCASSTMSSLPVALVQQGAIADVI